MEKYNIQYFEEGLSHLEIKLSGRQIEQFIRYYEMLIEWNKLMNLTGITEYEDVINKHFIDSLSLVKATDLAGISSVIDIGTGAGFPGIPLKIAFPHLNIVLLDSLNKRINFLNAVIEELGLENIRTIHGRAEEFAQKEEYRECFDLCVSRAVANLSSLTEYCLPYVKEGGKFIPYKSGKIDEELANSKNAIFILGGKLEKEVEFELPRTDMSRNLVVIEKVKKTPKKYPRKAGLPTKSPIE
ncbi:16S rRNA (guanine(527)-N(7))-methyltransferase RsmG [Anaerobium acetethylicum]|uniref:Ribosomal RNA small subunit methyltransferase G n=1 Tax=Anaerobium acetethylicum TaxID=1619234 RepID=A0A1D3TRS3_9FIRM|nr:16S rRNA (guanine(527)-N(7))-methyltransferase RsmG [Anaerobium acetethylicum]SCP96440.1 16S rRNA (guanine527-N7)-methyltransferase [Anaerobium acetethylicum]